MDPSAHPAERDGKEPFAAVDVAARSYAIARASVERRGASVPVALPEEMRRRELLERLIALQDALTALFLDLARLCSESEPNMGDIGATRWRIAQVSRRRMTLLSEEILPLLAGSACEKDPQRARRAREELETYRRRISDYVRRWSTASIVGDWIGYRADSEGFRAKVTARFEIERGLLDRTGS